MNEFDHIVPKLSMNIDFVELENGYILCTHHISGHRLKLNRSTYNLLKLVDGKRDLGHIISDFNKLYHDNISQEEVQDLFENSMKSYGLVYTNMEVVPQKVNPNYLRLRIDLIKSSFSSHFTKFLFPLFRPQVFWIVSVSIFIFLSFIAYQYFGDFYGNLSEVSISDLFIGAFIMGVGLFAHEFGHIAACDNFGANHGNIGFGFYLFTPVMYADVTDIWRLPVRQRLIVNLAGIYMGNFIAFVFFIVYIIMDDYMFLYLFYLQFFESLYNLNPFIKYDGYWILSDLINVPNLHKEAYSRVWGFRHNKQYTTKDWLLTLYGTMSLIFIIVFLISVLILAPDSLLMFPINIYNYFKRLFFEGIVFNLADWVEFIPPFIFYYLVLKLCYSLIKRRIWMK